MFEEAFSFAYAPTSCAHQMSYEVEYVKEIVDGVAGSTVGSVTGVLEDSIWTSTNGADFISID